MRKAGVAYPEVPSVAVDLKSVQPTGSHHFDATFTYEELVALLEAFTFTPKSTKDIDFRVKSVNMGGTGLRVYGDVYANGMALKGWIEGPVVFADSKIKPNGSFIADTNGFAIDGARAAQVANIAITYLNAYLAAAPGLKVQSATVTSEGIHATGTAPDRIAW
jgi:hypothetical protein